MRISHILQENFGSNLISLCLFGSASRGSLREGSDIDFLVVLAKAPASYHSRANQIVPLADKIRDTREYETLELLRRVSEEKNIVGFDIVELSPIAAVVAPDFLAARLVYKLMAYINNSVD